MKKFTKKREELINLVLQVINGCAQNIADSLVFEPVKILVAADDEVLAEVTLTNDEDGIVHVIERYFD